MKKHIITLSTRQRHYLEDITTKGQHNARVIKRAHMLLKSEAGITDQIIANHVNVSVRTIERVRARFSTNIERALFDAMRPGAPTRLTTTPEAHLIATACTDPPEDAEHWTLALLQNSIIAAGHVKRISTMTLWRHLSDRGIKPWLQKMWCIPKLTVEYISRMEDILNLYEKAYDPLEPVICLDEKSTQILAPTRATLPHSLNKPRRCDYEYRRLGTRNLFMVIEPKRGRRQVKVTKRRTRRAFAYAVKNLIINLHPGATTIHVVMDNLNTHFKKSLVDTFGAKEADRLWKRITPHYTPKHASWLNMAEIEIGVVTRQVLKKRWDSIDAMIHAVATWRRNRNLSRTKINWKFTTKDARRKFEYTRQN
jgi:transposase